MKHSSIRTAAAPRWALLALLVGVSAGCSDAARTGTVAATSGTSWSEGTFVDTGAQAPVYSVEVVAIGGRGGNVGTDSLGGAGCAVRSTVRTYGVAFSSQLGTNAADVDKSGTGGQGGAGLGMGGNGGSNVNATPDAGGAGGGGATAVWRDGITIAIAAGGGGAALQSAGGAACASGTQDGGDGAGGSAAGTGGRLVSGVRTAGAGGTTSGGSAGTCNFPSFATQPIAAQVGGAGASANGPLQQGGGGGGAGDCGGGGGSTGAVDHASAGGGGGAGLSYGWSEYASSTFAPATYSSTTQAPRVVFHWVQITTGSNLLSATRNYRYETTLRADFGETGALTSTQGARWRIITGGVPGLGLDERTGILSGYPWTAGTYSLVIEAAATTNGLVIAHSRKTFTIVVQ